MGRVILHKEQSGVHLAILVSDGESHAQTLLEAPPPLTVVL